MGSPRTQNIGGVRDQILRAIESINKHVPDLNEFFLEFDPYEGRVFEMWELVDIFNYLIRETALKSLCEEN